MDSIPWILISVVILLVLAAFVFLLVRKKKKRPTDYYTLFIIGISWLAIGLPLANYPLFAMGVVLTIVGLIHKDKWKQNHVKWEDLDQEEKRLKLMVAGGAVILLILGLAVLFLVENGSLTL